MATYTLTGRIINKATGEGLTGLGVQGWDRDARVDNLFGEAISDERGDFTITCDDALFSDQGKGPLPDVFIKIYSAQQLIHTSKVLKNRQSGAKKLQIKITLPQNETETDTKQFIVMGKVLGEDGRPLTGLIVSAIDKAIGTEKTLGYGETNLCGEYVIRYTREELLANAIKSQTANLTTNTHNTKSSNTIAKANLFVRVFASRKNDEMLAESSMVVDTRVHEVIDLQIPATVYVGPSLFKLVQRNIDSVAPNSNPLSMTSRDIELLSRKTQLNQQWIEAYLHAAIIADELDDSANSETAWQTLYGILLASLADGIYISGLDKFSSSKDPVLLEYINKAINENWIESIKPQSFLDTLRPQRLAMMQRAFPELSSVLKLAGITQRQVAAFIDMFLGSNNSGDDLWNSLLEDDRLTTKSVNTIRDIMSLLDFTNGHSGLLKGLIEDAGIKHRFELSKLDDKTWAKLVKNAFKPLPEWLEGTTDRDKINHMVSLLIRSVERHLPTATLLASWKNDPDFDQADVITFLEKYPTFDFATQSLASFLQNNPTPRVKGVKAADTQQSLERTERLFHITPVEDKYASFKALWQMDISSSQGVVQLGVGRFTRELSTQNISSAKASQVFRLSQRSSSRQLLSNASVKTSATVDVTPDNNQPVLIQPTIAALFGEQGGNTCDHCLSAFSPNAYLIDLLRFLERASDGNGVSGLEWLFFRRADIANLQLDCENSDTLMPYIDLVNEILEHVVATSALPFKVPDDWQIEDTLALQTELSAEELASYPEHLDSLAYNRLRLPGYPWSLPYSLWSKEVRSYLTQIGIDRRELLNVLIPDSDPLRAAEIALERVPLDASEALLIAYPADTDDKRSYLWQTADPAATLSGLMEFLQRSMLSYEDAEQVFSTHYVNPQQKTILPTQLDDIETAQLVNLDNHLLDRFHHFARLWQKTQWSSVSLDAVIDAVGKNDLNADNLTQIGFLSELNHLFKIDIEELASWFGNINTLGNKTTRSLYARLFLDNSIYAVVPDGNVDLLNEVFAIYTKGNSVDLVVTQQNNPHDKWLLRESTIVPGSWELHTDYSALVSAACNISADDIILITEAGSLAIKQGKVSLNLKNLSRIYRLASMSRALQLSVTQLLSWQSLVGIDFGQSLSADQTPQETLILLDNVQRHEAAGMTADALRYALMAEDIENISVTDETIEVLVLSLQSELLKAVQDNLPETLTHEESLAYWFDLQPSISDEDTEILLSIISNGGVITPVTDVDFVENNATFLSAETLTKLFGTSAITDRGERLVIAASDLPLDMSLLKRIDDLLYQDPDLDSSVIYDLILILLDISPLNITEATELVESSIPYIDVALFIASASTLNDRMLQLEQVLFDRWVLANSVLVKLAQELNLNEKQVELLLVPIVTSAIPAAGINLNDFVSPAFANAEVATVDEIIIGLKVLYRYASLINMLDIEAESLSFMLRYGSSIGIFDFNESNASLLNWHGNVIAEQLNALVQDEQSTLYSYLTELIQQTLDIDSARDKLAELFTISNADLQTLLASTGLNYQFPADYDNVQKLERLYKAADFIRQAGVSAEQVQMLAAPTPDAEHANIAKSAARSHYDETTWYTVSSQLREDLREQQRDALIDFVISRTPEPLSREHAYAYYLIDVEMSACFMTSRTKQAIASVQQFIQRILLNMELGGLAFDKRDAAEWKWRKNYRVWEANVKVFVFPENYLRPELRDNKTSLFDELEQQLMQGELTDDLAQTAVTNYLEKLHEISNLEIMSTYEHKTDDGDGGQDTTLYVIGRTRDQPHQYHLRSLLNNEYWSPWEKIDVEMGGNHIVCIVYNNRLHIFWAIFTQKVDEEKSNTAELDSQLSRLEEERSGLLTWWHEYYEKRDQLISDAAPAVTYGTPLISFTDRISGVVHKEGWEAITKEDLYADGGLNEEITSLLNDKALILAQATYQEINLEWVVRSDSGWAAKKLSKGALRGELEAAENEYRFAAVISDSKLEVQVYSSLIETDKLKRKKDTGVGAFVMDDCMGELLPVLFDVKIETEWQLFTRGNIYNTQHKIGLKNNNELSLIDGTILLQDSVDDYSYITTLHQDTRQITPFFLADNKRTFFVKRGSGTVFDNTLLKTAGDLYGSSLANQSVSKIQTISNKADFSTSKAEAEQFDLQLLNEQINGNGKYIFENHYHPFTCALLRQIRRYGLEGVYKPDPDVQTTDDALNLVRQLTESEPGFDFDDVYAPNRTVVEGEPQEKIDFQFDSAYGLYNWECFFHIPMLIACRLMDNLQFEDAQKWFHYIIDPNEKEGSELARYWNIKPFYVAQLWGEDSAQQDLDDFLDDTAVDIDSLIDQWTKNPFQPHIIARFRIVAYMRMTLMKYLDNLIAWGDSLFTRDDMESISEATQLYVFAANILGQKPLIIDAKNSSNVRTIQEFLDYYASTQAAGNTTPSGSGIPGSSNVAGILQVLEQFCVPFNSQLLDYWDRVADRLFKIRHCMNIDGVVRQLPLYEPPINPMLLVNAAAAGVNISSVISDLSAPLPYYRFTYSLQKANELCAEVRSLGAALLSAHEKKDAEGLSILRADQEIAMLNLQKQSRQLAIDEANESLEALYKGRRLIELREDFYSNRKRVSPGEVAESSLRAGALLFRTASQITISIAGPQKALPDLSGGMVGVIPFVFALLSGGGKSSGVTMSAADVLSMLANIADTSATLTGVEASHKRRTEEWDHQSELAHAELKQFDQQTAAAQIRLAMAEKELTNHQKQMQHSADTQTYLQDKFTNQQLYDWMLTQLSVLYFQTYQLAYDIAKRAERCYQHELGIVDSSFIQFGYWNSLKKGLLAGESLQQDLRRLETSYIESNIRELELSKSISLMILNPLALIRLIETGECYISLPESIFALDYAGHYFRRIKNVSLSIPAITGPQTTVSCTLTLLSDRTRVVAQAGDEEELFHWNAGAMQSMATSNAQSDSGVFQLDFRDERYLPFERAGVVSSWKLQLPKPELAQFDYSTISDIVMQINYTARDGGEVFRSTVEDTLIKEITDYFASGQPLQQLISLKESSDDWARLANTTDEVFSFSVNLGLLNFPYYLRARGISISNLTILLNGDVETSNWGDIELPDISNIAGQSFAQDTTLGLATVSFELDLLVDTETSYLTINLPSELVNEVSEVVSDIYIICSYKINGI